MRDYSKPRRYKLGTIVVLYIGLLVVIALPLYILLSTTTVTPSGTAPSPTPVSIRGGIGNTVKGTLSRKGGTFDLTVTDKKVVPGQKSAYIIEIYVSLKNTSPADGSMTGFSNGYATRAGDFGLSDADRLYSLSDADPHDAHSFTGIALAPGQSLSGIIYFEADAIPSKPLMLTYRGDDSTYAEAVVDL